MTPQAYAALQKKKWESEGEKYLQKRSLISKFTGDVAVSDAVGNKVADQVPQAIISMKKFSPEEHTYSTTIPMIERLVGKLMGGTQKARGSELRARIKNKTVFYNNERTPMSVGDESVEGDTVKWTQVGNKAANLLKDRLVETTDYRFHKAVLEGDPMLTEAEFWLNSSITAPVTKAIHSRVFANSKSKIAWNATYNTYDDAIKTAADALTTDNIMDQGAVEDIIYLAGETLSPINEGEFTHVTLLSGIAFEQLTGGASNSFMQMFRDAGERAKDNVGLTGDVGVFRGHLWMKDVRAPIYNIASANGSRFEYIDPASEAQSLARIAPGSETGTCEVALTFGVNAIGQVKVGDYKLEQDFFDYKFEQGMCSMIKHGFNRMEFLGSDTAVEPLQKGSFVYLTASKDALAVL